MATNNYQVDKSNKKMPPELPNQVIGMIGAKCLISSGIKILRNTHDASTKKPYFSSKNYT